MSLDRSYQATIDYLFGLQKHGIKLELTNSLKLMELLDNPHRQFRSVHIAGTNGKGSTAVFLASILQTAGYRVGLYTSPHLVYFSERIRINGEPIAEHRVVELAQRVRSVSPPTPTFFEVTTAIAFEYFAEQEVDIAVIEVGMGGRFDSTNVITPLVSVITNIELEHQEYLGTTLELIAAEKAGIIKPGVPVVTGAGQPEVISVIEQKAVLARAPLYRLSRDFMPVNSKQGRPQVFDYQGMADSYPLLRTGMLGAYQVDNACLALAAAECLRAAGIPLDEHAVRHGIEKAHWEGRLERVSDRPDIYLDGAHNPAAAKKLAGALREMKPAYRRTILIIGILGDKDCEGIVSELVPLADHVVATQARYSRAMDSGKLAAVIRGLYASVTVAETVEKAVAAARSTASSDDLILITGSLYVAGDARALLRPGFSDADTASALRGLKG